MDQGSEPTRRDDDTQKKLALIGPSGKIPPGIESAILDPAPAADEIPMATRSFLLPLLSYFARVRLNIEVVLDVY
jgi:hypothetical protein